MIVRYGALAFLGCGPFKTGFSLESDSDLKDDVFTLNTFFTTAVEPDAFTFS